MYLWYMHMNDQKVPFYATPGPGVQVLLHGTDRQKLLAQDYLDYTGLALECALTSVSVVAQTLQVGIT